jgi:hypothetical protein
VKPSNADPKAGRRPYQAPKLDKESFFEETGLFGSGDCSSHWCQTSGYCSHYNGNDCN